jgi:serine/threonine protein kinase
MFRFSFETSPRNDSKPELPQLTKRALPNMETGKSYSLEDLRDQERFSRLFKEKSYLGKGADGLVMAFEHRASKDVVAVKMPNVSRRKDTVVCAHLTREVINLTTLGKHDNLSSMINYSRDWKPYGPAIFFQMCEMGDVDNYRKLWCLQQYKQAKSPRPAEATVWKLLSDMALAIDYMNTLPGGPQVHNDIKPLNILVAYPTGWKSADGIPMEPVFKLTDFARMTPFPVPTSTHYTEWAGTPEYSPNRPEDNTMRPSKDIWSLGATLQDFALGILPIQSRQSFIWDRKRKGLPHPQAWDDETWHEQRWRERVPTVFRPLNASKDDLFNRYDVPDPP